jgi:hypothetical protein
VADLSQLIGPSGAFLLEWIAQVSQRLQALETELGGRRSRSIAGAPFPWSGENRSAFNPPRAGPSSVTGRPSSPKKSRWDLGPGPSSATESSSIVGKNLTDVWKSADWPRPSEPKGLTDIPRTPAPTAPQEGDAAAGSAVGKLPASIPEMAQIGGSGPTTRTAPPKPIAKFQLAEALAAVLPHRFPSGRHPAPSRKRLGNDRTGPRPGPSRTEERSRDQQVRKTGGVIPSGGAFIAVGEQDPPFAAGRAVPPPMTYTPGPSAGYGPVQTARAPLPRDAVRPVGSHARGLDIVLLDPWWRRQQDIGRLKPLPSVHYEEDESTPGYPWRRQFLWGPKLTVYHGDGLTVGPYRRCSALTPVLSASVFRACLLGDELVGQIMLGEPGRCYTATVRNVPVTSRWTPRLADVRHLDAHTPNENRWELHQVAIDGATLIAGDVVSRIHRRDLIDSVKFKSSSKIGSTKMYTKT